MYDFEFHFFLKNDSVLYLVSKNLKESICPKDKEIQLAWHIMDNNNMYSMETYLIQISFL